MEKNQTKKRIKLEENFWTAAFFIALKEFQIEAFLED